MDYDPLELLGVWLGDAERTELRVPSATILSTIGLDGFPNARGVAIKRVYEDGIIVTGPRSSRKGRELAAEPRCALTCWWDALGRQVRVQGTASDLPRDAAQEIFMARPRDARIVAEISEQGAQRTLGALEHAYATAASGPDTATTPATWGGWVIEPLRIEFMEFFDTRFHERTLYERNDDGWVTSTLQP